MLQLKNPSPAMAAITVLPDADGVDTLFTIVKATFTLSRAPKLLEEQLPIRIADEHHGAPPLSSIRAPGDAGLTKPGTDVVLIGSACARGLRPVPQLDVALRVGPAAKVARVFGDRQWSTAGAGAVMSHPEPFVRMPLTWERAFGGVDQTERGPQAEPRNPVGVGFRARSRSIGLHGQRVPNVEDPSALIAAPDDRPAPCGFAPVAPSWQPRLGFAGTYDDTWQTSRAPYLPRDFDSRFFHFAPPGLCVPGYLHGGEPLQLRGVLEEGELDTELPAITVTVRHVLDGESCIRAAALESVIIEPDRRRFALVWRSALPCDKKVLKVREVEPTLMNLERFVA